MTTLKQWELPNKSKVILRDGQEVTYLKMDGMYAQWNVNGQLKTGNFKEFKKEGDKYIVV